MQLSALYVYPIKSCAALVLDRVDVEPRGLAHDRRWMIVDSDGRFLTGRQLPRLVLLCATPTSSGLRLHAPTVHPIEIARPTADAVRRRVTVWGDEVDAPDAGDAVAHWLSAWLGRTVRLVFMDAPAARAVSPDHAQSGDEVSFADGYPLLAISQASLDGLNVRLDAPLPMLRFRPNLVIADTSAHAEDAWRRVRVGDVEFEAVKVCVRCVFTTVDPEGGDFDPRGEPLRTLKTYRRSERGITFGMNLIARGIGTLRIGDAVTVLEAR